MGWLQRAAISLPLRALKLNLEVPSLEHLKHPSLAFSNLDLYPSLEVLGLVVRAHSLV